MAPKGCLDKILFIFCIDFVVEKVFVLKNLKSGQTKTAHIFVVVVAVL